MIKIHIYYRYFFTFTLPYKSADDDITTIISPIKLSDTDSRCVTFFLIFFLFNVKFIYFLFNVSLIYLEETSLSSIQRGDANVVDIFFSARAQRSLNDRT